MKLTSIKKFIIAALLLAALAPTAQSQNIYQNECLEISNDGHITVKIWNPKKGKRYKMKHAQKDAIQVILINGIASNEQCIGQKPLLQNDKEKSGFDKISKDFFKNKGNWLTYVHSSKIENALPDKIEEKNWKVYQVTINRDMLKKYLEEQKIIKPIKTGF